MAVTFGIFDHVGKQTFQTLGATFADRLRILELADRAGFYSYHLAEHHGTPLGLAPAPSVFLAAVTQRTRTLRLGALVVPLPLYHPLRLIEEVCMLDQLSGGRLDLGVGRGVSPIELGFYGIDALEARERFLEELDILLLGLRSRRLTYDGRFHQLRDVPIELSPVQKPHPPLWYPSSAPDRIPWIAERGFNTVLPGGVERVKASIERYWEVWQSHHGDDEPRPRVGVERTLFVADSDDEAFAIAEPNFRQHHDNLMKLWREHDMPTATRQFTPHLEHEMRDGEAFVGSPNTVRDKLAEFVSRTGAKYIVLRPIFGDMRVEQVLYSLGLFVDEVMPALATAAPAPVS
jgi:alkanesulfonate monooxygenase SsuD/methylene tetrahydromethanopterin reductase-like flavin-dependent oxidoreductase (luciferase family)